MPRARRWRRRRHLSGFFVKRGCDLVVTQARAENLAELRRRHPRLVALERDVEEPLTDLGRLQRKYGSFT